MLSKFVWIIAAAVIFSACTPDARVDSEARPTAPPTLAASTTAPDPALATRRSHDAEPTPSPTPAETGIPNKPFSSDTLYNLTAVLDWTARTVHTEQHIEFRNDTGVELYEIVFNVDANRDPGVFSLQQIGSDKQKVISDYVLDNTCLSVRLSQPLHPDESITLSLKFDLAIPFIRSGYRWGHLGYLGYSMRQVNLGMWFPLVSVFDPDVGWVTPQFHSVGEHFVLRQADFTVELSVIGADNGLRVAGPGKMTRLDNHTWRFELDGAREMAFSISPDFRTLSTVTASGVKVELFYLPDSVQTSLQAPRHALQTAADALTLFENLYGPYPYPRLTIVEGDFPDGMEFSGLVFVSGDWFRAWQGVPNDWLTIITAHEVSHQWWYAQVGNDQGDAPYLDEALATYSEALFFEHYYPEYVDWWWGFRVQAYGPQGFVDTAIYEYEWVREYLNAVYLRGALMMDALRSDLGDEAFLAWLRGYVQQMKGHVANPTDFWGTLQPDQLDATRDTRAHFLRRENVLLRSDSLP